MSEKIPYDYREKPVAAIISRRGFLKVTGIIIAAIAIAGYKITDVFENRNNYMKMRQAGLYKDDARLQEKGLAVSDQNPAVKMFYSEFAEHPLSKIAEELLHTDYYSRTNLILRGGHNVG
ncbi:ferredoxin hydrogenase small subunit [Thermodesulfobium acidiphilum]|uniref:Ferredoxin hydrogenase small subunit n=1 Tax=Thermodesulfobium acidiphilum TaxID=1794699 RepID=A0A2R4W0Q9_THEAF|nr:iron hydrogenase small subunit [Thermodesulfobium acidiphilum]AWB10391.1 ferredoxin hydrogenase small subunit [Thermodesulfobium acidiphilum]